MKIPRATIPPVQALPHPQGPPARDAAPISGDAPGRWKGSCRSVSLRTTEDVVRPIALCREYGAPLFNRGGRHRARRLDLQYRGLLDFSKYLNHILEIEGLWALGSVAEGLGANGFALLDDGGETFGKVTIGRVKGLI